jgi:acetyl-CoA/propionyl-CoA carboxylase carboxyl transferase subunit
VVDEVVDPTRTRTAIARAIDDAVQADGVRRGQHGNIPL